MALDTEPTSKFRLFPSKTQWVNLGQWLWNIKHLFWTIWFLNVVAWGGMIFLLIVGGGKAMCHPTCDDLQSPRKKWIEVDSQILNALFCVPAFGFLPWRFRDLWLWFVWRAGIRGAEKKGSGIRRLAEIHRDWFRLEGNDSLAYTELGQVDSRSKTPVPQPSRVITPATPTKSWKMDVVVWAFVWNTLFQALLAAFMWGYNRFNRPGWAVGLWLCLGFACSIGAGIIQGLEKKRIKKAETKVVEEA